jgi:serine/threonine protein kinase
VERIGRYEVEGEIGRGAMGVVYLAHDPRVRRRLALKTYELPQGIAPEQAREYRERFVREAQSAGALSHPAIVTIYDVDEDPENGASYIAMEYVPGNSLRKLLRTLGRMEPERAILLGTTVAEALQVAHDAGIVHRDVKPDNILVREPDGAFKIADFGIARLHDSDLTQAGLTVGSPAYMSPEQIRSRHVDGRSRSTARTCRPWPTRWPTRAPGPSAAWLPACRQAWMSSSPRPWPRTRRSASRTARASPWHCARPGPVVSPPHHSREPVRQHQAMI